jgi:hypothetical protein
MTDRKKPGVAVWATVVVVSLPLLYLLGFGPACWLTAQSWENGIRKGGWDMPPRWMVIYRPFGAILSKGVIPGKDSTMHTAVKWWATVGIDPRYRAVVPSGLGIAVATPSSR